MVPCQRNSHFTGRKELLKTLQQKLSDQQPQHYNHRVALYGLGGVGKTQLALQYVYEHQNDYDAVFWISAADKETLQLGFQEIARIIGCAANLHRTGNTSEVVRVVLSWFRQQTNWLLVLDNLDDIRVVGDSSLNETSYLPEMKRGGHVLVTTRDPNVDGIPAQGLEIDVFGIDDTIEFLLLRSQARCEYSSSRDSRELDITAAANKIVQELGLLALAIEQAAAYIREECKDIFKYLSLYTSNRRALLHRIPRGSWHYQNHQSVATTWNMSFQVLQTTNPAAIKLLRLFVFLGLDDISLDFVLEGQAGSPRGLGNLINNSFDLNRALASLEQFSLIRRSERGNVVSIHRLVRSVIEVGMSKEERDAFEDVVVDLWDSALPEMSLSIEVDVLTVKRHFILQILYPLMVRSRVFDSAQRLPFLRRVRFWLFQ